MTADLAGRTALVTGAGNGLGRAIALRLASSGARVVLVGRRVEPLQRVASEVADAGGSARAAPCDVSDESSVDMLRSAVADEVVSIVVNNAGIPGPVAPLTGIDVGAWDEVFAVNVRGVFLICRAFLPAMLERRAGHIVNIASVTGKRPLPGRTPYAAAKLALIGLTATLAHEVGEHGVVVNSLSPGPVRGERMKRNFRLESMRRGIAEADAEREFVSRAALHRMVEESEVADAVLAMLSMPGLCGADIDLSAGMVAR